MKVVDQLHFPAALHQGKILLYSPNRRPDPADAFQLYTVCVRVPGCRGEPVLLAASTSQTRITLHTLPLESLIFHLYCSKIKRQPNVLRLVT